MSTRAAIGRVAGDSFEGRYQHSDGYPTWLGKHYAARAAAAPDLAAFVAYVTDEHKAGWSYLGAAEDGSEDRCYCHAKNWEGGRECERNAGEPLTDCDLFIEWAYAVNVQTRTMGVWASVSDPLHEAERVSRDGSTYAEPGYRGQLIAIVEIDDPVTDWEAIENKGNAAKEAAYVVNA